MGEKGITKKASRTLINLTEGFFSHSIDFSLWLTIYLAELSLPQRRSSQTWRAQISADRFLNEVNYDVIKNAINEARRRGLIKKSNRHANPKITAAGKRRLQKTIPHYDEKRAWDNRIHLVTYDIPEKRHHDRDRLRDFLKRLGCAKLQESIWLTPYNPIDALREFINDHKLEGTVIVSDLGADGAIGEESIANLLVKIYELDKLNGRYVDWLDEIDKGQLDHWSVIKYLSILRDDPQLPFSLLPKWWKGDEAYQKIKSLLNKF